LRESAGKAAADGGTGPGTCPLLLLGEVGVGTVPGTEFVSRPNAAMSGYSGFVRVRESVHVVFVGFVLVITQT
jgi:hypothetical protein